MTEQADSRRAELIATAQTRWVDALTDLGGRNTLLYYKDRRAGTLDLAAAAPEALDRLQRSGTVRLTRLFHDVDVRADAIRRMQAIYRKARELTEERGLAASYLATGSEPDAVLDDIPPADDYTILDADSSQRSAIDMVVRGQSLVIHGPPGTGKSQTIANLIAALVARGRKVLFVAEKRAAIDAVLSRLKGVELGGMVLDIHDGTRDRLRIARDLGDALEEAQRTADPDVGDLHRRLIDRQRRLSQHVAALHEPHQPWEMTPIAVQSALLRIPSGARTPVRLRMPEQISRESPHNIPAELAEVAHPGGVTFR